MSEGGRAGALVTTLALLGVVALVVGGVAPTVAADSHENGTDPYVIEQGGQCVDVDPVVNESQSVQAFYDYRNNDSSSGSATYSSHGTTEYQADNTSILMLYRGSEGTSLVIVHEKLHEPESEGTNGSSATFVVTGVSPDGWVVEDDDYENQSDRFDHYSTYSEIDWVWAQGRTDGAAYRGLEGDVEIGIQPAFNESADLRLDGHYGGYVHDWQVITATEDGDFERIPLESLSENVTLRDGYCAPAPNASLSVSNATPEVGTTTVTLDASNSTSATGIDEYRWDLSGNDSAERVSTDPTIDHVFETTGEREMTVTVVAGDGQIDDAAVTVNVTDETPPTAQIDAPGAATVGETITVSGTNSTDNHRIDSYDWSFGDGTAATGSTVNYSYDSPGEYTVTLTVTDPAGYAATANATVEVTPGGPNASVVAEPANVSAGDPVTFDATASTGNVTRYEWAFGDGTTIEGEGATVEHEYVEPGTYEAEVTVVDGQGEEDTATTVVEVTEADGPVAQLDAPSSATVNETVTLDASASEALENATYEWEVDGTTVNTSTSPTYETTFETTGEHVVVVNVSDPNGSDDATATIAVGNESDGDDKSGDDDGSDDGGDSGGGSGNAGSILVPQPEPPTETSVAIENGAVVVTADNADAARSFTIQVPSNTTLGAISGPNASQVNDTDDVVGLRSIEVTPATHADTLRIRFTAADDAVPGRFTVASAIVPNASAPVRSISYEVAVARDAMTAAGVSADDLTGHARADDGSWRSVRTTTTVDGDRIVATATADGEGALGVGAVGPVLFVRDVATTAPATNGSVELAATLRNTGNERVDETLAVERSGERLASLPVALGPGERRTVETTVPIASDRDGVGANDGARVGDDAQVTVGGRSWGLAVVHVTDLSPSPRVPGPNETATVRAELVNRGAAGEVEVPLRLGTEVVTTRSVSLAPGERRTVTLEYRTPAPGSYPIVIGDANTTVEVAERASFTDGDAERTESALPGFGIVAALLGLAGLLSAAAIRRRRGRR